MLKLEIKVSCFYLFETNKYITLARIPSALFHNILICFIILYNDNIVCGVNNVFRVQCLPALISKKSLGQRFAGAVLRDL